MNLKKILLATVLLTGLSAYADAPSFERRRLKEQPDVGKVMWRVDYMNCKNGGFNIYETENGFLYSVGKVQPRNSLLKSVAEKTEIKPWAFNSGALPEVYVDVDGDGIFDFKQTESDGKPCDVLADLKKYIIKD